MRKQEARGVLASIRLHRAGDIRLRERQADVQAEKVRLEELERQELLLYDVWRSLW